MAGIKYPLQKNSCSMPILEAQISRMNMPVTIVFLSAGLLFIGALPLPYEYYLVLRVIAFIVFAWAAIHVSTKNKGRLFWASVIFAVIFNPFMSIHLPKEIWMVIDVFAGIFLISVREKISQRSMSEQ